MQKYRLVTLVLCRHVAVFPSHANFTPLLPRNGSVAVATVNCNRGKRISEDGPVRPVTLPWRKYTQLPPERLLHESEQDECSTRWSSEQNFLTDWCRVSTKVDSQVVRTSSQRIPSFSPQQCVHHCVTHYPAQMQRKFVLSDFDQ